MATIDDLLRDARDHLRAGRLAQAEAPARRAVGLGPGSAEAHNLLGMVLHGMGDGDGAEGSFRRAAELGPDQPSVLNNLGTVLLNRGDLDGARTALERAVRLQPDFAEAHNSLGAVWVALGRFADARSCFARVVGHNPRYALAHHNLGSVLHKEGRLHEAESSLRQALRLAPAHAPAHYQLGAVLKDGLRLDEARDSLEQAVRINPAFVEALGLLAAVVALQGRADEARALMAKALAIRPDDALKIRAALILPVIYESHDELHRERDRFREGLARLATESLSVADPADSVGMTPFFLAYQGMNDRDLMASLAAIHRRATPSLDFVAPHCRGDAARRPDEGPIRVGFLSGFFHRHTVGKLNMGLVRGLSRDRFSVTLLRSPGPDDPMSRAFEEAADRVVTLPRKLDEARQLVADERLDVLYYPEIGMDPLTYYLAFARLAPVQCASWGHPVTSGIPKIDAFLSAAAMEPDDADGHYTERLVRFDRVNVAYDEPRLTMPTKSRRDFGLDDGSHLYVCTQSLYKMHPDFDEALGAILRGDPRGEVVLLSGVHPHWGRLLAARFRRSFPDVVGRVRFLPPQTQDDFLHLQAVADVLLDTYPFGGGNTSYEAFAFGTPVVTLPGPSLRGRLTSAFYRQMGVLDCVAATPREYVDIALRLGTDPSWREEVRGRILAAKHRLYGDAEAVRALERFLDDAVRRARAAAPP